MRCFLFFFFFSIKNSPGVNILDLVQVDRSFSQTQTPRSKHVPTLLHTAQLFLKMVVRGLPGSPVVKSPCLHLRRHEFNPWSGH